MMATQTVIDRSKTEEKTQRAEELELIATTFGNLTRDEIREWERMLGQKLVRLFERPSTHAQPVQQSAPKPRHQH
jgi:hypothetical protein